ncbi:hypothetical protein TNCV_2047051 [Trichonephila clavipes]|uniref:Uncharacterized protein n=1 Tax=Trichonephila clavipes TaxID=2585209 RepID=A0A8X6SQW3_TRICX|nr:hypothetical protein TNCV_2047051 [Trichonephila clavipes]
MEHVWDMMGRRLYLTGNVDPLAQQLEPIWHEIPQETIRVLYHSMSCCVAACIQARGNVISYNSSRPTVWRRPMHVKYVESSNVLLLVWCGTWESECQLRCHPRRLTMVQNYGLSF